jgi:hypothetical protein
LTKYLLLYEVLVREKFMNTNNPYLVERLIELKMEDVQKEMRQVHLRKKAGLAGTTWYAHLVNALFNLRRTRHLDLQDHPHTELRSYQHHREKTR